MSNLSLCELNRLERKMLKSRGIGFSPGVLHLTLPELNRLEDQLRPLLTLVEDMGEALQGIQQAIMAHHSGGDSTMIFDSHDAVVERERKGWYSINDTEVEKAMVIFDDWKRAQEGK